jgi:hypothetical protein
VHFKLSAITVVPFFPIPFFVEFGYVEDSGSNTRSMHRWLGVHGSDENLHLTFHRFGLFLAATDHREGAHSFTIQAHILSKWLREYNLMTVLDKVSHSLSITISVVTSEALIGHVEIHKAIAILSRDASNKEITKSTNKRAISSEFLKFPPNDPALDQYLSIHKSFFNIFQLEKILNWLYQLDYEHKHGGAQSTIVEESRNGKM